jgi:hypothetical protein
MCRALRAQRAIVEAILTRLALLVLPELQMLREIQSTTWVFPDMEGAP